MTRTDITDHLGLRIETVSRTFIRRRAGPLLEIPTHTEVVILGRTVLENLAAGLN
jgi:CRP-like cAMP-binding protein